MATRKANTKGTKKADRKEVTKIGSMEFKVLRAFEFNNGGISFDLSVDCAGADLSFYRLGIREGKEGAFIAFPSYKGSDGNYYHYFYLPLSDELQDQIIQAVYDQLDNAPEAE